ncbi:MAG: squalene synthase HpnC [Gammaproteobacteria bacterium]|nr:squalene synthase HpnC [Gammaproteobacteria bacterium]
MTPASLEESYLFCQKLAQSHYENFPVASVLLPKRLRRPISVIYAFARTADDFADEGDAPQEERLEQLNNYSDALQGVKEKDGHETNPIFIALADVIEQHDLPIQLFDDLLDAFKQDVVKDRYNDFDEVLDYCRRSADPVGRLLLLLSNKPTQEQLSQSDAICSALQLINFYQDIVQDMTESDRIYIPTRELTEFNVAIKQLAQSDEDTTSLASLMRLQYQRTQKLMSQGYQLGSGLNGRIGWEVRAMTLSGITTLNLLMLQKDSALLNRPRLSKFKLFKIMLTSMSKRLYSYQAKQLLHIKT